MVGGGGRCRVVGRMVGKGKDSLKGGGSRGLGQDKNTTTGSW